MKATFNKDYPKQINSAEAHERLKSLINKVMIRNRRHDTGITWTKRHVETVPISFSPQNRLCMTRLKAEDKSSAFIKHVLDYDIGARMLFKQRSCLYDAEKHA